MLETNIEKEIFWSRLHTESWKELEGKWTERNDYEVNNDFKVKFKGKWRVLLAGALAGPQLTALLACQGLYWNLVLPAWTLLRIESFLVTTPRLCRALPLLVSRQLLSALGSAGL